MQTNKINFSFYLNLIINIVSKINAFYIPNLDLDITTSINFRFIFKYIWNANYLYRRSDTEATHLARCKAVSVEVDLNAARP